MQKIKFTKMQGLGNDYVYINCFTEHIEYAGTAAKKISDRHFGIGSDGLVLICPSETADFKMQMYNADGSEAEMCGNAIRCVGKYVYERGLTTKENITVETLAGQKHLELCVEKGTVRAVCVDMGSPQWSPELIPVGSKLERFIQEPVEVEGKQYKVTAVSIGNPHAVVFMEDLTGLEIEKTGPLFEHHPLFPKRINTEFAAVLDRHTVKMRVWERGAGETLACGTGACAVMAAAAVNGFIGDEADILLLGGCLHIRWDRKTDRIYMTGPAEFVFDGEIFI